MNDGKKAKRWERTNTANLWKLAKTGGYYARVKISGKEKWKSLKTKLSSVAKLRLTDFERAERQRAKAPVKVWPGFPELNVRSITALQCKQWALDARAKGTGFVAPNARRKPGPMSSSAFNKTLSVLRAVLEIAVKNRVIYANPTNEVARMPPKKKHLILPSVGQFQEIIRAIAGAGARQSRDCADMVSFLAYICGIFSRRGASRPAWTSPPSAGGWGTPMAARWRCAPTGTCGRITPRRRRRR